MKDDLSSKEESYGGHGWNFIRIRNLPEGFTAPASAIGALLLSALFSVGIYLIWSLVSRVVSGGSDTVPAASAALTAIAAIFGAAFLTWRTVVAHWQARASLAQVSIARESHYTTLFTKAVEQLGATRDVKRRAIDDGDNPPTLYDYTETEPNLEVRLGAIYALERIAKDSERDRAPILEVFCSYVRNPQNCGNAVELKDIPDDQIKFREWKNQLHPPRIDIKACIRILSGELAANQNGDLSRSNLQNHIFIDGALAGTNFDGSNLGASSFNNFNVDNSRFNRAIIVAVTFQNCLIRNADLDEARFSHVRFEACHLTSSQAHRTQFSTSIVQSSDWQNASFESSRFSSVIFVNSNLPGASFRDGVLDSVQFVQATLNFASFKNAYLNDVVFSHSEITGASFEGATLHKVGFFGSDLTNVAGLTKEMLSETFGDSTNILPNGMDLPQNWSPTPVEEAQIWQFMHPEYATAFKNSFGNTFPES